MSLQSMFAGLTEETFWPVDCTVDVLFPWNSLEQDESEINVEENKSQDRSGPHAFTGMPIQTFLEGIHH